MNGFNRGARVLALAAIVVMGWQALAHAQVFQPYWSARAVSDDSPAMGGAVGFGDEMFRLAAHGRFSMTSMSDLGLELVFDNYDTGYGDDEQAFGFGGDFKYLIVGEGERLPFDLAAQAGFGMEFLDDVKSMVIPFGVLGSKSIPVGDEGRLVTPFGGAYVVIEHVKVDTGPDDATDTDVSAEIRLGSAFQIKGGTHAFAALHTGNGTMFFLGMTVGL
jgi:hypothetical protein